MNKFIVKHHYIVEFELENFRLLHEKDLSKKFCTFNFDVGIQGDDGDDDFHCWLMTAEAAEKNIEFINVNKSLIIPFLDPEREALNEINEILSGLDGQTYNQMTECLSRRFFWEFD